MRRCHCGREMRRGPIGGYGDGSLFCVLRCECGASMVELIDAEVVERWWVEQFTSEEADA